MCVCWVFPAGRVCLFKTTPPPHTHDPSVCIEEMDRQTQSTVNRRSRNIYNELKTAPSPFRQSISYLLDVLLQVAHARFPAVPPHQRVDRAWYIKEKGKEKEG